jgi:two-component system LytT family response regulator
MSKIRALIVDDEVLARRRLKQFLSEIPDIEVIGECEDGRSALAFITEHAPDLLFLDVQMPVMDGFSLIQELNVNQVPAIIFVTAYDEFALRAFEVHALDYLLKPFNRERFRRAVEHARLQIETAHAADFGQRLKHLLADFTLDDAGHRTRLAVRSNGRTLFISTDEIDWIRAANSYTELHVGRETHLLRETISQLERQLDPRRFVRIHRSTIVNIARIREMSPLFNRDQVLILRDGTRLSVSRTYYDKLMSLLKRH